MSLLLFENIGTFNVHEVFWMRQCNCTKNDEATFFILNIDCFLCKTGYCCTWMKTRNAQLSRSLCYIFTFLCLSLTYLLQVKQTVKVHWLEGKLSLEFLKKMWLIEYQTVTKYQDFYHCGRWLHHHNSWGFHVRFFSVKQSLTLTT